jgi:hypothetical protein
VWALKVFSLNLLAQYILWNLCSDSYWCCSNCSKPRCCRTNGWTIPSLVKVLHSAIPGKEIILKLFGKGFPLQSCLYSFSTQLCAWSSEYFNFASIKLCPLGPDNIEFSAFQRLSSLPLEMGSCHCCRLLQVLWQTTKGIIYDKSTLTPVGEIIQILSNQKPCAFATQENLWSAIGAVDRLQCKGFSCYVNMLFNGRSMSFGLGYLPIILMSLPLGWQLWPSNARWMGIYNRWWTCYGSDGSDNLYFMDPSTFKGR